MLYNPSNPSPYNKVVDYASISNLAFSASCVDTRDVVGMRLAIKDDKNEYYLPVDKVDDCKTKSSISIPFNDNVLIPYNSEVTYASEEEKESAKGYRIQTSNFRRYDNVESVKGLLKPYTKYRWQVRLYEEDCNMNIGYGFVDSLQDIKYKNISSNTDRRYSSEATHILRIRPHTDMFWHIDNLNFNYFEGKPTGISQGDHIKIMRRLTEFYDDVKYQIELEGGRYDIVAYYYNNKKDSDHPLSMQTDAYGQPLFAYIEIKAEGQTFNDVGGEEYSIYANYIDSNDYPFSCRTLGTLKFVDTRMVEANEIKFVDLDVLEDDVKLHTYSPLHTNVCINGSFDEGSGVSVDYYNAKLYQVIATGDDILIHDSGDVKASYIEYDCKDLLPNILYKVVITVIDQYNNSFVKGIYIKPNCSAIVKPSLLKVESYKEHNSIILDFGKLVSMTGQEAEGYKTGYTIHTMDATYAKWADGVNYYTGFHLSGETEDPEKIELIHSMACEVNVGNTITWSKYDGTDMPIMCKKPIVSTTFNCSAGADNQTIFEVENGNYLYRLTWELYRFHLWIGQTRTYHVPKVVITVNENNQIVQKTITEIVTKRVTLRDLYYKPYVFDPSTETIDSATERTFNAMKSPIRNYSMPFIAYEDINLAYKEDEENTNYLFLHTESVAKDCWWHVIVHDGLWYMKCVYSPGKMIDPYEEYFTFSTANSIESPTTIRLYGGCTYCNCKVAEYSSNVYENIKNMKDNPLKDLVWNDDTRFQINFYKGIVGGSFDGGFSADEYTPIHHFRIYKKYSNQPQLHKIFETDSAESTFIEDFAVGSKCPYTYYIVPVCYSLTGTEVIGSIIQSDPIELNDGTVRVIGLIQDPDDLDVFYIDSNNIWNFAFNMTNDGFQNNMGKTYNDTPNKYPVEIKNEGFNRTFNISGLLGKYDCDKQDYIDTYDDIIEWENFVNNDQMKLVIDLRGVMTVGTMETSGIQYDEHGAESVTANFSIRELEDINRITILNRSLLYNPNDTTQQLLYDVDGIPIQEKSDKYLIAKGGES